MNDDEQQLQLLAIFHYIVGGLMALFFCFPLIHVGFGIAIVCGALNDGKGPPPPAFIGWLVIIFAGMIVLFGWSMGACIVIAGRKLAMRRHWTFCLVVAGLECMFTPFGTVLGVFTILVLYRPSVKKLFRGQEPPVPPGAVEVV